jgi:hypothetical protein
LTSRHNTSSSTEMPGTSVSSAMRRLSIYAAVAPPGYGWGNRLRNRAHALLLANATLRHVTKAECRLRESLSARPWDYAYQRTVSCTALSDNSIHCSSLPPHAIRWPNSKRYQLTAAVGGMCLIGAKGTAPHSVQVLPLSGLHPGCAVYPPHRPGDWLTKPCRSQRFSKPTAYVVLELYNGGNAPSFPLGCWVSATLTPMRLPKTASVP